MGIAAARRASRTLTRVNDGASRCNQVKPLMGLQWQPSGMLLSETGCR